MWYKQFQVFVGGKLELSEHAYENISELCYASIVYDWLTRMSKSQMAVHLLSMK